MKLSLLKRRPETVTPDEAPTCPHVALVPRWEVAADIGHEDRVSEFRCDSCGALFSPGEARALRRSEGERIESSLGTTASPDDADADAPA